MPELLHVALMFLLTEESMFYWQIKGCTPQKDNIHT